VQRFSGTGVGATTAPALPKTIVAGPAAPPVPTESVYCTLPPLLASLRTMVGAVFGKLSGYTHASIVMLVRLLSEGLAGTRMPALVLASKRNAWPTLPGMMLTPGSRTPLLEPALSVASPSPRHQAANPEGAG